MVKRTHAHDRINRRAFLARSSAAGAAALTARWARAGEASASATDVVPLGKTGLSICRLGMGTGSNGGSIQRALGEQGFADLVRAAYERGVTYFDTADAYQTHGMLGRAIKGLPREKLFIQSKIKWEPIPEKPLEELDRFRKELDTDYIDCVLIHCATTTTWPQDLRPLMDALTAAKERGLIRAKGVSCHGLPGLRAATPVDWVDVHLVRINPQGRYCDGAKGDWGEPGDMPAAMVEIAEMHRRGRGMIGMKIIGNGDFTSPEDRERSIRSTVAAGVVHSMVIGFKSAAEIDEAIERIDGALAERV